MTRHPLRHALPGRLPEGERVLWQGAPDWRGLARGAMHLRGLALYFAVLVLWVTASMLWRGAQATDVARDTAIAALAAAVPLGIGLIYAWAAARAATYTITNRRVVIRSGVALPMTVNLPFARVEAAGLRTQRDGSGEIRLRLLRSDRFSSLVLWPHARVLRGEPVLRAMPDAARVGQILGRALHQSLATGGEMPMSVAVPLASAARVVESDVHGGAAAAA